MKLVLGVLTLMAPVLASAAEPTAFATKKERHVMCAAANGIVATKMDPGVFQDSVTREARRHGDAARKLGATDQEIRQATETIAKAYNDKKLEWEKIVNIAETCAKEPSP